LFCFVLFFYFRRYFMSDAKSKLEALKANFAKKDSGGGGDAVWKLFYPFWKCEVDSVATVRFLPDLDANNSLGFLVESLQHELVINGQKKKVPCLTMHGEDCPICNLSRKYYDEKNEAMGKKYYRKKSYIGQVIVIESPIEHDQSQLVKLIEFGPQVFKQIQAAFQSGDLDEAPYEFKGGYNFRFRKTTTGGTNPQNSYTTSNFSPKQTDLEDELVAQLELYTLADYRGAKIERETVEALLVADQTGGSLPASATPADKASTPPQTPAAKADHVDAAPEPKADDPAPGKTLSVIEQLRARAAAKAAA
jgi:hypothetical protein